MVQSAHRRRGAAALLVTLALALSACLLTPGRFASTLDLRRDGRFTFTYAGEIHMLALSKLAQMGNKAKAFEPDPCYTGEGDKRPCTAAETYQQRQDYDARAKAGEADRRREADQAKALLGGIDPSDPKAAEELAARLRRQAGWKSVIYKGDGLFVVDYALSGRIDHDFLFPTMERMAMVNAFVQVSRHQDGTVRIDAPGFSAQSGAGNPFLAMMGGLAAANARSEARAEAPFPPVFEGTFTVTTDGAVLANNTDEGPQADPAGQKLAWAVNARNAAPTALVRLGN